MLPVTALFIVAAAIATAASPHGHHKVVARSTPDESLPQLYTPQQVFEISTPEESFASITDPIDVAKAYAAQKMNVTVRDFTVTSS
ncbi:hypothetical protein BC829DRAFT_403919 [Chytridium lagenaria]|nr:hypothetical protein BC829DRAFT_403919 [Chytridium lagenaria]